MFTGFIELTCGCLRGMKTHSIMTDGGSHLILNLMHVLSLDVFPDHPSPGRGVAPGALCVCVMQQGARHPRVFRERRTGLLWEGLPSSLFPSLWILQGPNHGGSSTYVDVVINKWVDKKHPHWCLISENVVVSGRKSWQPWTRVGILNTFSAPTVETCLGRKVRYPVPYTCTSC